MLTAMEPVKAEGIFSVRLGRPTPAAVREARVADPGFGQWFTDHMVSMAWTEGRGWHDAQVAPHAPLRLSPAAMVLHYGQSVFEGLKAYRQPDGRVALFRPSDHARRFRRSAERLAIPVVGENLFVHACAALVRIDDAWVPHAPGHSLYLRPLLFATEPHLGVRSASEFRFVVIASPVAPYFPSEALDVVLSGSAVRAAPGGLGAAKCSTNYAASLLAREQATSAGHDEVVWLDAIEHRWIEEMSAMNVFLVRKRGSDIALITPPLSDTILDGITRASIITLGRALGYRIEERPVAVSEWEAGARDGEITEAFACGTGAVIAPIGRVSSETSAWTMSDAGSSPVALGLREALVGIQEGRDPDPYGWRHPS